MEFKDCDKEERFVPRMCMGVLQDLRKAEDENGNVSELKDISRYRC